MARPGLIAALLLPLPFAALPLLALILGGPTFGLGEETTVYVPVTSQTTLGPVDVPAGFAHAHDASATVDGLRHGCDDFSSES